MRNAVGSRVMGCRDGQWNALLRDTRADRIRPLDQHNPQGDVRT
jgi:hypothetical protein